MTAEFLTINEACVRYSMSRRTFCRVLADERSGLRSVGLRFPSSGRIRVPIVEFEAWLRRKAS